MVYTINLELAEKLMYQMRRIRYIEFEIARKYSEEKMRCPVHLSIGQEGVAAGVCSVLRDDDLIVSGHRAHAHYLSKGGNLRSMIAEIYGKVTGCSRGKGGSMHLIDESVGFMGSTAIVGGTVPIGVGLAYAIKYRSSNQISCIFLGDAVIETGVFFESASFAALKKLPVLFVCENNLYSVYSHLSKRQPKERSIAKLVDAIGIQSVTGNGNDICEVYNITSQAVNAIRNGCGPRFLEFSTYRWLEHCGPNYDNDIGYRTEDEFKIWKANDPIENFLSSKGFSRLFTKNKLFDMDKKISIEVADAFNFAETSPFPELVEANKDLYCNDRSNNEKST